MENFKTHVGFALIFLAAVFLIKFMFFPQEITSKSVNQPVKQETAQKKPQRTASKTVKSTYNSGSAETGSYLDSLAERINAEKDAEEAARKAAEARVKQAQKQADYNAENPFTVQTFNPSAGVYGGISGAEPSAPKEEEQKNEPPKPDVSEHLKVRTSNAANLYVPFYLYIPGKVRDSKEPVPVIVWAAGMNTDGFSTLHPYFTELADKEGFAVITPSFKHNDYDFNKNASSQYPAVWSGRALLDMVKIAESKGLNAGKFYLAGFSAGGQFVSRFSFLYPDRTAACAIFSSGARVKPESNQGVKYFYGVGVNDDDYHKENAEIFNKAAVELGIPIVYNQYQSGHDTPDEEFQDAVRFFEQVKKGWI